MSKFQELINSETPVLVDFYAEWCGPCKAMAPVLKEIAGIVGNRVPILKVDVDKNPEAAMNYQIQGVPTFILFKKGQAVWRQSGAIPKATLLGILAEYT